MNRTINTVLKWVIIGGIFAIPFIPFYVSGSMLFPFISGKNFAFRIIVEIITAAWLILAIKDASYRPKFSWLFGAISIFVGVILISDLLGPNVTKSLWSNFERMEGWVTLIHLWMYFVVLGSFVKTVPLWKKIFNTTIVGSLLMAGYGFLQLAGAFEIHQGGGRLDGTLGNATYLAIYMVIHIFLALYLSFRKDTTKFWKIFYAIVILCNTIILFYTATRGAILGLVGGAILVSILLALFQKERPSVRRVAIGSLISLFVLVVGFIAVRDVPWIKTHPVLGRFASISITEATTMSRFTIWSMAFEGFKERPILGWGQENFNYVFNKHYDPKMYGHEQWFDRTHNVIFDWLIAGGVVGLLSYLSIFFFVLWYVWKKKEFFSLEARVFVTGLLAAYFVHNLFVFDNLVSYIFFFLILGYIHAVTVNEEEKKSFAGERSFDDETVNMIAVPAVVIVLCIAVYMVNIRGINAGTTLITALRNMNTVSYAVDQKNAEAANQYARKGIDDFKKALSYNTFGNTEIREQLMQAAPSLANNSLVKIETRQELAELAIEEMKKQVSLTPNDARYNLFTGNLLRRFGMNAEAVMYLEKARELSPKKQTLLFDLGSVYLSLKEYNKAYDLFKYVYYLDRSFDNAAQTYVLSAVYVGKQKEACSEVKKEICDSVLNGDAALRAYVDTKNYSNAITAARARITADPTNPQHRVMLAYVYTVMGDITSAVAQLEAIKGYGVGKDAISTVDEYIKRVRSGENPF